MSLVVYSIGNNLSYFEEAQHFKSLESHFCHLFCDLSLTLFFPIFFLWGIKFYLIDW